MFTSQTQNASIVRILWWCSKIKIKLDWMLRGATKAFAYKCGRETHGERCRLQTVTNYESFDVQFRSIGCIFRSARAQTHRMLCSTWKYFVLMNERRESIALPFTAVECVIAHSTFWLANEMHRGNTHKKKRRRKNNMKPMSKYFFLLSQSKVIWRLHASSAFSSSSSPLHPPLVLSLHLTISTCDCNFIILIYDP